MENSLERVRQLQGREASTGTKYVPDSESLKAQRIARACALNAAAVSVESFARIFSAVDACKGYDAEKISTLLRSIKTNEYQDNLKLLCADKDEDAPF